MRRITPASERAQDFRVGEARPAGEILLVVQADADAVGHPAAAAGALVGRGLADRLDQQLLDLAAEAVALDARRAGVDHVADARHRQRGLGHVGGQHDAPAGVAVEDAVLLGLRQPREQRQHLGVAQSPAGAPGACAGGRPPRGSRARRAGTPGCRPPGAGRATARRRHRRWRRSGRSRATPRTAASAARPGTCGPRRR